MAATSAERDAARAASCPPMVAALSLGSTAGAGSPSKRARVSASWAGPNRERMARMVRRQREAMGAYYADSAANANKGPAPVVRSGPTGGRGTGAVPLKHARR